MRGEGVLGWYSYIVRYVVRWVPEGTHLSLHIFFIDYYFISFLSDSYHLAFVAFSLCGIAFVASAFVASRLCGISSAFVAIFFSHAWHKIAILHPATSSTSYIEPTTQRE